MIYYLAVINLFTLMMFSVDKISAGRKGKRIPESTLFILAIIGGSVGALLGMYICRHKTRKMKFVIGIPVIIALQLGLAIFLKVKGLI